MNEADDIALKYVQQIIDDKIDKPISDIVAFVSGIQFLYWNLFGDILVSKDNISTKTLLDVLKECNANASKGSLKYLAAIAEELRDQPASMLLETIVALQ